MAVTCRWNKQVEACETLTVVVCADKKGDEAACKMEVSCLWNEQATACETLTMPSYQDALTGRVYQQVAHYGEMLEQFNKEQEAKFDSASGTL